MGDRAKRKGEGRRPEPEATEGEAAGLDRKRLEEAGAVPRVDATDLGESGAPERTFDTRATHGPGAGARYEGGRGGSGAKVAPQRRRGRAVAEGDERPAAGGPRAGLSSDERDGEDEPGGE